MRLSLSRYQPMCSLRRSRCDHEHQVRSHGGDAALGMIDRFTKGHADWFQRAFSYLLKGFVLTHCSRQARCDEGSKGQRLTSLRLVVPQKRANLRHIDFEQAVDHRLTLD